MDGCCFLVFEAVRVPVIDPSVVRQKIRAALARPPDLQFERWAPFALPTKPVSIFIFLCYKKIP
jgi:hypothetical protein